MKLVPLALERTLLRLLPSMSFEIGAALGKGSYRGLKPRRAGPNGLLSIRAYLTADRRSGSFSSLATPDLDEEADY